MAEITTAKCAQRADSGPHCWHSVWTLNTYQPGQYAASTMKCCWCGEVTPLMTLYDPPKPHGPHMPANIPGALPPAPMWK